MERSFLPRLASALFAVAAALLLWSGGSPPAHAETFTCTTITSVPVVISTPGHYCLQGDVTLSVLSASAIEIRADDTVIDCNGHALKAIATNTAAALYFPNGHDGNTVRNCVIDGYYVGIFMQASDDPGAKGNRIEGNDIVHSRVTGIMVYGSNNLIANNHVAQSSGNYAGVAKGIVLGTISNESTGNVIRDNVIGDFKPTPPTGVSPTVSAIEFNGLHNTVITGNTISGLYGDSGSSVIAILAYNASGSLVANNTILAPSHLAAPLDSGPGTGIYLPGTPEEQATNTCRDNVVGHFTSNMVGCVVAAYNTSF